MAEIITKDSEEFRELAGWIRKTIADAAGRKGDTLHLCRGKDTLSRKRIVWNFKKELPGLQEICKIARPMMSKAASLVLGMQPLTH